MTTTTLSATFAPRYEPDFYGDAFIRDPIPQYRDMRALGPVVWLAQNNCYAATHYTSVVEVLRGADRFLSGKGLSVRAFAHLPLRVEPA